MKHTYDMIPISDVIKLDSIELEEKRKNIKNNLKCLNLNIEDFKKLFLIYANDIMASRRVDSEFRITENNRDLINQMYYYINRVDEKFKGDLQKGIMIIGKNGVGKTLILKSIFRIIHRIQGRVVFEIHAKKLDSIIKQYGIEYYERKILFIDDIGKEAREVNDYGTKIQPVSDILALRYDSGSLTFGTCNYKLDTLNEFYGLTTTDRMKEMFNFIELKGDSFRK